ncbi:hypothetical protein [Candidatus Uabimicrobium sp. HlEnr_7]|uniref:hypothetical protein n=1 Tax=Candidatus Uabimicrobium helgolandensis TaxID=3095367 RepID=UPI0035581078
MKIIAFTAQSFGFGPVRKMIAIAEKLNGVYKIFFGSGVTYDFAKAHIFDEYHYLENNENADISSILNKSDVFINVMDFELGNIAKKSNCKCIVVDSLLWFYPFRPDIDYADYYFVQDFFRSSSLKIKEHGISNAYIIGPIVEENDFNSQKIEQCIINFGGSDGKICNSHVTVGKNTNYPFIMLHVLLPLLSSYFKHVLVVGRESIISACSKRFSIENVSFAMLNLKEMCYELSQSQVVFSVPGIHSFLDAANKLPIFFLPPSNHSHQENLDIFIKHAVTSSYFSWTECYGLRFKDAMPRQQKISIILKAIERFDCDSFVQKQLQKSASKFLENKDLWPEIIRQQQRKLKSLGKSGLETIISTIETLLSSNHNNVNIHNDGIAVYNN